jgi:hypothetical protein
VVKNASGTWSWSLATADGPEDGRTVTITATDSDGASATATFELVVENLPPVLATAGNRSVSAGATATNTGTWSDPGTDSVVLTASVGTVTRNDNGTWSWSFDTTGALSQQVVVTGTDADGLAATTAFNLSVDASTGATFVWNAAANAPALARLLGRERLDGIVNNACQTIRRPAAYYAHLMPLELQPGTWNPEVRLLLADHVSCFGAPAMPPPAAESRGAPAARLLPPSSAPMADATTAMPPTSMPTTVSEAPPAAAAAAAVAALWSAPATGLAAAAATIPSALWSQAPLWSAEPGVPQPDEGTASQFPLGVVDVNGQQLDTRTTNSWLLKLHEVSTPEVIARLYEWESVVRVPPALRVVA